MTSEIAYTIEHSPAYAMLRLTLQANQTVIVESGAMAAMDHWIRMKSKVRGGVMKGVGRMFSGESLFMSEFTAHKRSGELFLAPAVPGSIEHYRIADGVGLMIQSSGFVASSPSVTLDTKFQGFRGFFSGESLFLLRASGTGDIWFSSFGAILEIPVQGDYVVDTGYIVAFEDTLDYSVQVLGGLSFKGLKTGILGGEGLVCRFRGQGRVWVQSRHLMPFVNFIHPFRPIKGN